MCLNASLAGLVGITAGCANVDAVGATIIGLVDGILVVIVVEFIDQKLKIDDQVGAVAVHGCNGLWGTVAVGLFDYNNGVFYGGGFHQLGVQVLGVVCIAAYTAVAMTIVFTILKHIDDCKYNYFINFNIYFRFTQKHYYRNRHKPKKRMVCKCLCYIKL